MKLTHMHGSVRCTVGSEGWSRLPEACYLHVRGETFLPAMGMFGAHEVEDPVVLATINYKADRHHESSLHNSTDAPHLGPETLCAVPGLSPHTALPTHLSPHLQHCLLFQSGPDKAQPELNFMVIWQYG